MTTSKMKSVADPGRVLVRCLSAAAAMVLLFAAAPSQRAAAMSPVSPALVPVAKAVASGVVTEIRGGGHGGGGHGGGHGGGFHGGGFHGGGFHGGGWHAGGFHGGHAFHGGGFRHGGFHHGGFRFAHHRRHFIGGYDYPYYSYYHHPRCRVIWTYYGPRRICRWHHWHHRHWHHRHYW
jgi:hypothetical protein